MIKTVSYLLAVALATSAWTIKAEATGKGNPTGGKFAVEHPRRNEVNTRVDDQRERINQGVKNGTLTRQEAQQLRTNDRAIKQQEHADVKANGGHLTPAEQKQLNQEENANSTLIRDEKHPH
jgi:multidrug resistance efflux pump